MRKLYKSIRLKICFQSNSKKTLSIRKTLYPRYSLLFMFDIAINYLIYAKNALQVANMNNNLKG